MVDDILLRDFTRASTVKPGCDERDVWPLRHRTLDLHSIGMAGSQEKPKVQVEVNPRKKPYVTEVEQLLRWHKTMNVTEFFKVERRPLCSTAKKESTGDMVATFRTSRGWKIDERILQRLIPGIPVSAEGLKNDLEDMD